MSTIIIALAVIAAVGLVVGLLVYVNNRDLKREAAKQLELPDKRQAESSTL